MYDGWILLPPRDVVDFPFESPIAHTHCLALFDKFAKIRVRRVDNVETIPLSLSELVRVLELRRAFNSDCCYCSIRDHRKYERMTLWEHFFFGAEIGWNTESWISFAGDEMYAADPIEVSGLTRFARFNTEELHLNNHQIGDQYRSHATSGFLVLPAELFYLACQYLPLKSATAVRSTCGRTRELLGDASPLWRDKTISMHRDWFWELEKTDLFPTKSTRWMKVLWHIEDSRAEILNNAGVSRLDHRRMYLKSRPLCKESFN